jgi:tetratricopeptide (TPR) repeat protein
MASVGRNAPCPCGSGAKYKKCCLAKDEREVALQRMSSVASGQPDSAYAVDELDDLSNSVLDLVQARRFDQALAVCRRLIAEYPDVVDGLERSGLVYAAMGDHATAAAFYRAALAFVTHPSRRDDYEGVEYYEKQLGLQEELSARAVTERASGGAGERAP